MVNSKILEGYMGLMGKENKLQEKSRLEKKRMMKKETEKTCGEWVRHPPVSQMQSRTDRIKLG